MILMMQCCVPWYLRHYKYHSAQYSFPIYFQIYTDWANHYLEKARNKRYISDLQQDVTDGVLLADVIEAVSKYHTDFVVSH